MKHFILRVLTKAGSLNDAQLAQQIEDLETGKLKLYVRDERERKIPLAPIILRIFRQVQDDRKNNPEVEKRRRKMLGGTPRYQPWSELDEMVQRAALEIKKGTGHK